MNEYGEVVNKYGEVVNEYGEFVNEYGEFVNQYGMCPSIPFVIVVWAFMVLFEDRNSRPSLREEQ